MIVLVGTLHASTISSSWGGGSGNWSVAANWSPATVPNNGGGNIYDVTVSNISPYPNDPLTVLLDTSPTINSLTLGSPADVNTSSLIDNAGSPQKLTIDGPLTIYPFGNLSLSSSTVSAANLVLEPGSYQPGYATAFLIGSGATLNLHSGITDIPQNTSLDLAGSINSGGTAALAGLTTIEELGSFTLENGRATTITPNGGTMTNSGTFSVGGTATAAKVAGNIANSGLFIVGGGSGASLTVTGNVTGMNGPSQMQVNTGGKLIVDGNLATQSDAALLIYGGTANAGALVNNGSVQMNDSGIVNTPKLTNGGYVAILNGTVVAGSGSLPSGTTGYYQFANGTLGEIISGASGTGSISVTGPVHLDGTLDPMLENGFDPGDGESFIFLTFTRGELTGTFASIADPYFNHDTQQWVVTYGSDFVELTAEAHAPTPEPGSLWSMCIGLAGLGVFTRRRPKNR